MQVSTVLEYCRKELRKNALHVARSREAEKTIEKSYVTATCCDQDYHVLTLTCLVQWNCFTHPQFTVILKCQSRVKCTHLADCIRFNIKIIV